MFTEDLDAFFGDFATLASTNGQTALVIFDMPDQAILGDMQLTTEYSITFKSGDFTSLKRGDTITINSTVYSVREVTQLDDGLLKHATLSR